MSVHISPDTLTRRIPATHRRSYFENHEKSYRISRSAGLTAAALDGRSSNLSPWYQGGNYVQVDSKA